MVEKIEFFSFVQKLHRTVGIYPSQPNQKPWPINWKKAVYLFFSAQFMLTTVAFLVLDGDSMIEYGLGFFVLLSVASTTAIYLLFIWQMQHTLQFIGNCEGFIEKSEFLSIAALDQFIFVWITLNAFAILSNRGEFNARVQRINRQNWTIHQIFS